MSGGDAFKGEDVRHEMAYGKKDDWLVIWHDEEWRKRVSSTNAASRVVSGR